MTLKTNSWHRAVVAFMLMLGTVGVGALVAVPQDTPGNPCWRQKTDNCCNVHGDLFQGFQYCTSWVCDERDPLTSQVLINIEQSNFGKYTHSSWNCFPNTKTCTYRELISCGSINNQCQYLPTVISVTCDNYVPKPFKIDCNKNTGGESP